MFTLTRSNVISDETKVDMVLSLCFVYNTGTCRMRSNSKPAIVSGMTALSAEADTKRAASRIASKAAVAFFIREHSSDPDSPAYFIPCQRKSQ